MTKEHIIYERHKAKVKFYSREKGYGFLERVDNKPDVFFSMTGLEKAGLSYVKTGAILEFDLFPVPGKGGKAINIKLIKQEKKDVD